MNRPLLAFALTFAAILPIRAAAPAIFPAGNSAIHQPLSATLFENDPKGWTLSTDLTNQPLTPGNTILKISDSNGQAWLSVAITQEGTLLAVSLKTDYKPDPLTVAIPIAMLKKVERRNIQLRYQPNALDLYLDGVLIDQEWPLGEVVTTDNPQLDLPENHPTLTIHPRAITDASIEAQNGGPKKTAALAETILGPQPEFVQYSRPRGWNTNAGDAMPYFHDGIFHLYYLLDRRQHHSKWGLGAHQWAHISSPDLIHWTHHPVALAIDYDWEGSICTGSVFFNGGKYYAFYATRLRDRSEHLAMAESNDAIHFKKLLPSQFEEPKPPYVHGPNRDPFVFLADGKFHMIVTAAIPAGQNAQGDNKTEGALEHLTSNDLAHWTQDPEPFLRSGTSEQPECSDLFHWNDWYYLVYSLSGTTHYKIAKSPLGPWTQPENDILDGPEAVVMKAAAFRNNRYLTVGFLQHDNHYAGDLIFRELVQEQDGSLGSKFPEEMMRPQLKPAPPPMVPLADRTATLNQSSTDISITAETELNATLHLDSNSRAAIALGDNPGEHLVFDSTTATVSWTTADGKPEHAQLKSVTDLSQPITIKLILHGTIADLELNGRRTLVHRLNSVPHSLHLEALQGTASIKQITTTAIQ